MVLLQRTVSRAVPLLAYSCHVLRTRSGSLPGPSVIGWHRITHLTFFLLRAFSSRKQESYFSAIGGDSDKPPPDLTPAQVTTILRTNENRVMNVSPLISSIECNQLASNHPIEDRLRVARVKDCPHVSDSLMMGVFDGHGGGTCAEIVSHRLFHYIALALSPDPVKFLSESQGPQVVVENLVYSPKPEAASPYDEFGTQRVREHVSRNELYYMARYAEKLIRSPSITTTEERIRDAFSQCDQDLSEEIQYSLVHPAGQVRSNLLKHYYLSLAVSGCCANVVVLHENFMYVANTGDCRSVMSYECKKDNPSTKFLALSHDHNSDNVSELKRLIEQHPKQESNNIIRHNRLLGQLMPLRAFGDFGYKWPVSTIKTVGLTKAFGPHVIPPFYHTPPYLTAEPEVAIFDLSTLDRSGHAFLVIGTDGLWEQFGSSREVTDVLIKYRRLNHSSSIHLSSSSLEHEDVIDLPTESSVEQSGENREELPELELDGNQATYLLRSSLCQITSEYENASDIQDIRLLNHNKLVSFLTLSESVVRNFRDDISLIVLRF